MKNPLTGEFITDKVPQNTPKRKITKELLKEHMPKGSSTKLTDEIVEMINSAERDCGISQDLVNEQVVSYTHLLGVNVGFEQLLNAIKFCNLVMIPEMTNAKAYKVVFPKKAAEIAARGGSVDSFASMFNQTQTVRAIMKLLIVPAYITYQPLFHSAIKKQFDLMNGIGAKPTDKVSATVQHLAAAKLADLTRMPEESSVELKIGMTDEVKGIQEGLMEQIGRMASIQLDRYKAGEDISGVQRTGLNVDEVIEGQIDE